jgi:hypothetical protein
MFLKAEAAREGLELAEPGTPDIDGENVRRLKEYGIRLAQQLCPPRPGAQGLSGDELSDIALDGLLASLQQAVTARHGSINNFLAKIAALVPRAFGTYLTGTVMPIYMLPQTNYRYRLKIPGEIIQTNGAVEINGDLVWNFGDRDLAFTGQSMWARSILVRDPVVYSLGLKGFPESLADVDRMFGLLLSPEGMPREAILAALRDSAAAHSFAPLEAIANGTGADSASARGLIEQFEAHKRKMDGGTAPEEQPTAPPQTGLSITPSARQ